MNALALPRAAQFARLPQPVQGARERLARRDAWAMALGAGLAFAVLALVGLGQATLGSILGYGAVAIAFVVPPAGLVAAAVLVPHNGPSVLPPIGLGLSLVATTFLGCLVRMPAEVSRVRIGIGLLALVAYIAVSGAWLVAGGYPASQFGTAVGHFLNLATGGGLVLAAAWLTGRSPRPYLWAVVAAGALASFLALLVVAWGGPAGVPLRPLMSVAPDSEWTGRASGPFVNANYFAMYGQTVALVAVALLSKARLIGRIVLVAVLVIIVSSVLLAFSRGALLALFAGLLVLAFQRSRRWGLATLATGILIGAFAFPAFFQARLDITHPASGAQEAQEESDELRRNALVAGLRLFAESPIVGTGFGRSQHASTWYLGSADVTFPHNQYVKVLAEQGLVGVGLLALATAGVVSTLGRRTGWLPGLGMAVLASTSVAFLFGEPLLSAQSAGVVWLVLGAALAASDSKLRSDLHLAVDRT